MFSMGVPQIFIGKNTPANIDKATGLIKLPLLRNQEIIKDLYTFLGTDCIVAGSFVANSCSPTPVPYGDIDLFTTTNQQFQKIVHKFSKVGLYPYRISMYATTYNFKQQVIQVVNPLFKMCNCGKENELIELFKRFDFPICMVGTTLSSPDSAFADPDFIEQDRNRVIKVKNMGNPLATMQRLIKYKVKGYDCPAAEILNIMSFYSNLSPEKRKEFDDQQKVFLYEG